MKMKAGIYDRKTMADLLVSSATLFPDHGIGFVRPDGEWTFLTFRALFDNACDIAGGLQATGLKKGDKVMIVMSKNEEIIPVLWGCFLGGIIPTILQPPVSYSEKNQPAEKIINVFQVLEEPMIVVSEDVFRHFNLSGIARDKLILESLLKKPGEKPVFPKTDPGETAFIQFSSGSTGQPKGIMLTHENIFTNVSAICEALEVHSGDVVTNWMPLYHDMGLFGFHVCGVFGHVNQYYIDPVDFVKRPALYLDNMDRVRCTITGCPNFGQALLLRHLRGKDSTWDLSSVKVMINGAEPIANRIMDEFIEKLAEYGFRKAAMMPAYGMAEATLAVTFSALLREPVVSSFNRKALQQDGIAIPAQGKQSEVLQIVSVGQALRDVEIRITGQDNQVMPESIEGHIHIRGKGITKGYYNNPALSSESFIDSWFMTGDKGFFFEGNLYITGRVKDIIFMHGRNLYSHDLENLASRHADIPYGKVIFGGIFDAKKGKDLIILFLVGSANVALKDQFVDLHAYFRDHYGIGIDVFVPVRSNQVPKTSSGKIQRYKLLSDYENGAYDEGIAEIRKLIREKH